MLKVIETELEKRKKKKKIDGLHSLVDLIQILMMMMLLHQTLVDVDAHQLLHSLLLELLLLPLTLHPHRITLLEQHQSQ